MNLQPVYPGHPEVKLPCHGHDEKMIALSGIAFADLDVVGRFYCINCVKLMLNHDTICKKLENRDRKEFGLTQIEEPPVQLRK